MLEVKGTDAFYGSLQVLWDVSLEVGDETVCLIGPNGHGKTTIINVISGIIPHAVGYIKFNGEYIDKLPPIKSLIGVSFKYLRETVFFQL